MVRLIVLALYFLVAVVATCAYAFVGTDMWNWYLSPLLGAPQTNFATMYGVWIIVCTLVVLFKKADDTAQDDDTLIDSFSTTVGDEVAKLFILTIAYGILYAHHSWFM